MTNEIAARDISVVVATYCRPDALATCLAHLEAQAAAPGEIIVVDASPDRASEAVVARFGVVRYERNEEGLGTLPRSREIGVERSTGPVVAFLDDDAFAEPEWAGQIASAYGVGVGGVGGRARNGSAGEDLEGVDEIGRFLPNGLLTGNFAADPGRIVPVDHLIGCNMSFRRAAIEAAGGIPVWPAGVSAVREDLWLCLRVTRAGWGLVFNPMAEVMHIGAPQAKGKRFDLRYDFASTRNHFFVLATHFGFSSSIVVRCLGATIRGRLRRSGRSVQGAAARLIVAMAGIAVGLARAVRTSRGASRR